MNGFLLAAFLIAWWFSLLNVLFHTLYRRFPFVMVQVDDVSINEKTAGNAFIVTVWIYYIVRNRKRYTSVVFSGYTRDRSKLLAKAMQLKEHFRDRARFYYLPYFDRIGILDGAMTSGYMWASLLMLAIFSLLLIVMFLNF